MNIKKELEKISGLLADARNKLDEISSDYYENTDESDYDISDWTNGIEDIETEIDTYLEGK
tara:strand:+ start:117 stop:299 length:183 start_codon:yes stop_codon:yes gene_type:complete